MSFINSVRRAEIFTRAIMERIADCAVAIDLQNETLQLTSRSPANNPKARIGWAEETRKTIALSAGIIFEPLDTDKSILSTSLANWIPEAIFGFLSHVVKRPLDYQANFENSMNYGMSRRPGSRDSGTILAPT